jgi:hypothetical protein
MRTSRRHWATTVIVVLAVLLGSLWAGAIAAGAADPADRLTANHARLGVEAAVPPDRAPALRASAQRPDPGGRLLPLLGGLLAASLTVASGVPARRRRSSPAPARTAVFSAPRGPRAPPSLRPA